MALKRLICLLFVVGAMSNSIQPIESSSSTTAAPTSPTTTETTTTETTTSPTTTETTTSPTTTETTTSPTTTETTTSPTTTETTTSPTTTVSTTTTEPGACVPNPCGGGSTCQERANKTFVCLCLAGAYYDASLSQCVLGKAFPGTITYAAEYTDAMENPTSAEFTKVAEEIVSKLDKEFEKNPEKKYRGSTVTKLSKPPPASTKATGGVIATVEIQFEKDSDVSAKDVETVAGEVGTFQPTKLCDRNACDVTAQCSEADGLFTCNCVDKYVPTDFSDRLCVTCPKNEKAVGDTCEPCGFGYSGFNCEDNWQLILVIVGSVLGGLLLVTIILLPVVAVTTKKKSKKGKATDYAKPNPNPAPAKIPQITNGSAVPRPVPVQATPASGRPGFGGNAVPRIPRATTNESWERSNLEMVPSNSRQNLIPAGRNARRFDDQDDLNPYSRPIKPQNNPYAMGRPQVNPYASSQGNSNPYYRDDEARRF